MWQLKIINLKKNNNKKKLQIDDKTFGGGAGLIMKADIINQFLKKEFKEEKPEKIICLTPKGKKISQKYIKNLSKMNYISILCNRFEEIDQRIKENWKFEEISIGDFILAGGDVAAMALIESTIRLIPGVMKNNQSLKEESFNEKLLEYNHYTNPTNWMGFRIPKILKSGHHYNINIWRLKESKKNTKINRIDLWKIHLKNLIKTEK